MSESASSSSSNGNSSRNRNRNRNRSRSQGGGGGRPGGGRSGGGRARSGGGGSSARQRTSVPQVPLPPSALSERSPEGQAEERMVAANKKKALWLTTLPAALPTVILGVLAGIVLGSVACVVVTALVMGASVYWLQLDRTAKVLASLGAKETTEGEEPRLHNTVDGLCASMGLSRPSLWVVPSDAPNAMALGATPERGAIVVTAGLLASVNLVELEGVIAHELVHLKRADTTLSSAALTVASAWSVVAGTERGASMVRTILGIGREFSADQRASLIVRNPAGLRGALDLMVATNSAPPWARGAGRLAELTHWLWCDPMAGTNAAPEDGNLDDTRVRAQALSLY